MIKKRLMKSLSIGVLATTSLTTIIACSKGTPITDKESKLWGQINEQSTYNFLKMLWQEKVILSQYKDMGQELKDLENLKDLNNYKVIKDLNFIRRPEVKKVALFVIADKLSSDKDFLIKKIASLIKIPKSKDDKSAKYTEKDLDRVGFKPFYYDNNLKLDSSIEGNLSFEIKNPSNESNKINGLEILYLEDQDFKNEIYNKIIAINFLKTVPMNEWSGVFKEQYNGMSSFQKNNLIKDKKKGFLLTKKILDLKPSFQWEIELKKNNGEDPNLDFLDLDEFKSFDLAKKQFIIDKTASEPRLANKLLSKESKITFSKEIFDYEKTNFPALKETFEKFKIFKGIKSLKVGEGNLRFNFNSSWIENLGVNNQESMEKWMGFLVEKDLINQIDMGDKTKNKKSVPYFPKDSLNAKMTFAIGVMPYYDKDKKLSMENTKWSEWDTIDNLALHLLKLDNQIIKDAEKYYTTELKEEETNEGNTINAKSAILLDVKNLAYRKELKKRGYTFFKKYGDE